MSKPAEARITIPQAIHALQGQKVNAGLPPTDSTDDVGVLTGGSTGLGQWSRVAKGLASLEGAASLFYALYPDKRYMLGFRMEGALGPAWCFAVFDTYQPAEEADKAIPRPIVETEHDIASI